MMRYYSIILCSSFSLCMTAPLMAEGRELFDLLHASKQRLAAAKPIEAQADLIKWENDHPEVIYNPMFCYQRFFVSLEGLGDRETAKIMLRRLNHLVATEKLSANTAMYRSVTQAWYKSLFHADSDLPRQAHIIMQTRLETQIKQP